MERPHNVAHLKPENPFYALFPQGVPIKNIIFPTRVALEGSAEREAYLLDVEALTPEQFHGVANRLAEMFHEEVWTIRREMMLRGVPLRASQVRAVSTDLAWFL